MAHTEHEAEWHTSVLANLVAQAWSVGYLLALTHHAPGMTHDLCGILDPLSPCASADRHAGVALHRQCSGAGDGGGRGYPGGLVAAARRGGGRVRAGLDR